METKLESAFSYKGYGCELSELFFTQFMPIHFVIKRKLCKDC